MSAINYPSSNTISYINCPFDYQMKMQQQPDEVIFENVANQYVKGEVITAFFTISNGTKINPNEDQIGLIRVGCTNIKKCLSYSPVQLNSSITSGSIRHGKAIFPSLLIANDDEFYQFCYINNKTKTLGLSIPFQLNCTFDDIDLLSNQKHMLTNEEFHQENTNDMIHPCNQYQIECLHCRTVEDAHKKTLNELKQVRSQLNVTLQLTKDQATQIIELEQHLMKSYQVTKTLNQDKIKLEQQLRDLQLTFEKYQKSIQGQLNQLERNNKLLKEELNSYDLTHNKEKNPNQQAYITLKTAYNEIEKRCIRHQKNEIDLKRQLNNHENSINDLQHEIQYLTERLSVSTEEYRILFHKYNTIERKIQRNSEQEKVNTKNGFVRNKNENVSTRSSFTDIEMHQCPICKCQFSQHLTLNGKKEHINQHFE